MPKNSKTQSTNGAASAAAAAGDSAPIEAVALPKKLTKTAKKPALKAASKKTSAKKNASSKRVRAAKSAGPSEADIRLRAYFIAERRLKLGLQGDPSKDWLEARRQLLEEAREAQS